MSYTNVGLNQASASDTDNGASTDRSLMSSVAPGGDKIAVCPEAPSDRSGSLLESAVDINTDMGVEGSEGANKTTDDEIDSARHELAYATVDSSATPAMSTDGSEGHITSDEQPAPRMAVHQMTAEDVSSQGHSLTENEPVTEGESAMENTDGEEPTDGEELTEGTEGEEGTDMEEQTDGEEPTDGEEQTDGESKNQTATESEEESSEDEDEENAEDVPSQAPVVPVARVLAVGSTTPGSNVVLPMSVAVGGGAAVAAGIATASLLRTNQATAASSSMTYTSSSMSASGSNVVVSQPTYSTSFGNNSFSNPNAFRTYESPINGISSQMITNGSLSSVPSSVLNGNRHYTTSTSSYPMTTGTSMVDSSRVIPTSSSTPATTSYPMTSSSQHSTSMAQQNASSSSWATSMQPSFSNGTFVRPSQTSTTSMLPGSSTQSSTIINNTSFQPTSYQQGSYQQASYQQGSTVISPATNMTTTSSTTRLPVSTSLPLSSLAKPTISTVTTQSTALTTPAAIGTTYPSMSAMTNQYATGSMTTTAQRGSSTIITQQAAPSVHRQPSHESSVSRAVSHVSRTIPTTTVNTMHTTGMMTSSTPQTTPARIWTSQPEEMMNATTTYSTMATGAQTTPNVVYASAATRGVSTASGVNRAAMTYSAPMQTRTMYAPLQHSTLAASVLGEPNHFTMPSQQSSPAAPFMSTVSVDGHYHPAAPYVAYHPMMPAVTASISQGSMLDGQETTGDLIKISSRGGDEIKSHHKHHKHSKLNKKNRCACNC